MSDHTSSMRKALAQCSELDARCRWDPLNKPLSLSHITLANDALQAVHTLSSRRHESRQAFLENPVVSIVHANDMSPQNFRQTYLQRNIPCLIRDMQHPFFQQIHLDWTQESSSKSSSSSSSSSSSRGCNSRNRSIHLEWFRTHVGDNTLVPVRQPPPIGAGEVDEDGRAQECLVVPIPLHEWLHNRSDPTKYLKDWHLVQLLGQQDDLYSIPPFFQHDLLNAFTNTFTGGDFKFVYWGPAGSNTPLHSDVLHSFSWSYNVTGTKKWTLYPQDDVPVVVYQHAGEAMFVPSTWKHQVENVVETLSVNHNWITTANIDLVWECLELDMAAVQCEMNQWELEGPLIQESMLQGCSGMNVTSYFFLCMTSLSTPWHKEWKGWDDYFDIFSLSSMLETILLTKGVDLKARLVVGLASEQKAEEAMELARNILFQRDTFKQCLQESLSSS